MRGPEHPLTLAAMADVAQCHADKGKYKIAIPLLESCLEVKKRVRGNNHVSTLSTLFDLAEIYKEDKQLELALRLYEECLEGRRGLLGSEHKDTIESAKWVAAMKRRLDRQGKSA